MGPDTQWKERAMVGKSSRPGVNEMLKCPVEAAFRFETDLPPVVSSGTAHYVPIALGGGLTLRRAGSSVWLVVSNVHSLSAREAETDLLSGALPCERAFRGCLRCVGALVINRRRTGGVLTKMKASAHRDDVSTYVEQQGYWRLGWLPASLRV